MKFPASMWAVKIEDGEVILGEPVYALNRFLGVSCRHNHDVSVHSVDLMNGLLEIRWSPGMSLVGGNPDMTTGWKHEYRHNIHTCSFVGHPVDVLTDIVEYMKHWEECVVTSVKVDISGFMSVCVMGQVQPCPHRMSGSAVHRQGAACL